MTKTSPIAAGIVMAGILTGAEAPAAPTPVITAPAAIAETSDTQSAPALPVKTASAPLPLNNAATAEPSAEIPHPGRPPLPLWQRGLLALGSGAAVLIGLAGLAVLGIRWFSPTKKPDRQPNSGRAPSLEKPNPHHQPVIQSSSPARPLASSSSHSRSAVPPRAAQSAPSRQSPPPDDGMDLPNPLNPTSPLSPLNPLYPLWGETEIDDRRRHSPVS